MATNKNFEVKNGLSVAGTQRISAAGVFAGSLSGSLASATTATTQSASDSSTKIATTAYTDAAIAAVIGGAPGTLNTLNELAAAIADDASYASTLTTALATKLPLAGGTMTGDLILNDNVTLEIGSLSGGDLKIKHDGSNSFIQNATGNLFIENSITKIMNRAGNETIASFIQDGAVELYHNNVKKIETTAGGISVTGTVSSSSQIKVAGSNASTVALSVGDTGTGWYNTGSNSMGYSTNGANKLTINNSGGFNFVSPATFGTATLSSATNMLLTLNPTAGNYGGILFQYGGATKGSSIYNSGMMVYGGESAVGLALQAGGQYGLYVHPTTRNVGIGNGTSAPSYKLHVTGTLGVTGSAYLGGATANWVDSNDKVVVNGRIVGKGFGHAAMAVGRYNAAGNAGEDGSLLDFLHGSAGIGAIQIAEGPGGVRGLKIQSTNGLELKTQEQHSYNTVTLNGASGSTCGLGQFSNNGRGWWIRVTANSHYSSQVSSQVWEFTQNAYVGENHNTWLQVPETISSSYHAGNNHIALDVYRDNVSGSTSTPIQIRFRSKGLTGSNGGVYYTIESLNDMTYSTSGLDVNGTVGGTWANTAAACMNGACSAYYPTRSKYEFPVSAGQFWTDNAPINADGAKGLYISNNGTVGIGFDKHMHTNNNVAMAASFDPAGTLHISGNDTQIVQTSTYGSNSEFMMYVYNDYFKIFRNTSGTVQQALHINNSLVVSGDLNDTSDRNFKDNIVDLPDGSLAVIAQLKPVTFDWKNRDKGSNTGFIAQDIQTVLPNDVSGTEYIESEDDLHNDNDGLSINSTGIVAHLVKAVQELEKRIKELEG